MSIEAKMAWRNIWRNPRRTVLTISAIAFACLLLVFMLSFQFGSYYTMINASVKINTGHLQVQAAGYRDRQDIRLAVLDPIGVGRVLDTIPEIEAYTFRAKAFSLVSSGKRTCGALVVGIDPVREVRVSTIKDLIRKGSFPSTNDLNTETLPGLVGSLLADNLQVGTGDELTILGQGRDGSVAAAVIRVTGIYSSGIDAFDRSSIHIPLGLFQEVFTMRGAVHEVVAVGTSLRDIKKIQKAVSKKIAAQAKRQALVVLDWEELMPGLRQAIQMDLVSGIIFYLILIIVVAFSILNTFLMAIFERTREFGVMMAIGTSPGRLTKLLLIESLSITVVGIALGTIIGCLFTWYFQIHGIDIAGSSEILKHYGISGRMHPRLSPLSIVSGPTAVLLITFLAALYPALKVRSLRPVEALAHA